MGCGQKVFPSHYPLHGGGSWSLGDQASWILGIHHLMLSRSLWNPDILEPAGRREKKDGVPCTHYLTSWPGSDTILLAFSWQEQVTWSSCMPGITRKWNPQLGGHFPISAPLKKGSVTLWRSAKWNFFVAGFIRIRMKSHWRRTNRVVTKSLKIPLAADWIINCGCGDIKEARRPVLRKFL